MPKGIMESHKEEMEFQFTKVDLQSDTFNGALISLKYSLVAEIEYNTSIRVYQIKDELEINVENESKEKRLVNKYLPKLSIDLKIPNSLF